MPAAVGVRAARHPDRSASPPAGSPSCAGGRPFRAPHLHLPTAHRKVTAFYRAATQETARRLGLGGWVRNCADGNVELVACGDAAKLKELEQWLWQGPPHARVAQVTVTAVERQSFS